MCHDVNISGFAQIVTCLYESMYAYNVAKNNPCENILISTIYCSIPEYLNISMMSPDLSDAMLCTTTNTC